MARRVGARRRRALGDDHQEARAPPRAAAPAASRQLTSGRPSARQPPGNRPMTAMPWPAKSNAALAAIAPTTAKSGPGSRGASLRKTRTIVTTAAADAQRRQMHLRQAADDLDELLERPVAVDRHAQHLAEHGDADLEADAGEEADQHGLREEVGQEAELEQPRQQQAAGRQQRHQPRQRHVVRAGDGRQLGQPAGEDGRRRRIGRHHQVARRAEGRERHQRQQQRVEPGDHRRAGDPRVAQHLRDVHRRQGEAGQRVAQRPGTGDRSQRGEQVRQTRRRWRGPRRARRAVRIRGADGAVVLRHRRPWRGGRAARRR